MFRTILAICLLFPGAARAGEDPLNSVMWDVVRDSLFPGGQVVFDDAHVRVFTPISVEDNMNVPVSVQVSGLGIVQEVALLADHNPIPLAMVLRPVAASASFETRIKVQEATPIRAAARTLDGIWHVGGMRVDAAGGGCTAPSAGGARIAREDLNSVRAGAWSRPDGTTRLRLRISHPMDTGLIAGKPAFFVEKLRIAGENGAVLAELEVREPVAADPTFTLDLHGYHKWLSVDGTDNDGNVVGARVLGRSP